MLKFFKYRSSTVHKSSCVAAALLNIHNEYLYYCETKETKIIENQKINEMKKYFLGTNTKWGRFRTYDKEGATR